MHLNSTIPNVFVSLKDLSNSRKGMSMASLRKIMAAGLADQNRIRSMLHKLAIFGGMTEPELSERLENALRHTRISYHDPESNHNHDQKELAVSFMWRVLHKPRNVSKDLAELFRMPEEHFSGWAPMHAEDMLDRARQHGCAGCYWQQDVMCIQAEVEENFPEQCPGFKPEPPEEDTLAAL
jgi:hypothetical protein